MKASGTVRMREPLPLSRSPERPWPSLKAVGSSVADVEQTVAGIRAIPIPGEKLLANVGDVDTPKLTIAIAYREGHRRVVAPCARRLVVRAVTDHADTLERIARHELVGHAQGIANGMSRCSLEALQP